MLAGSISYFAMMAIIPLCLFLIAVFGNILGHYPGFYEFFAKRLISFFPDITSGITKELGKLIIFKGIGAWSILFYGIFSIQVFASLENAINIIFKVKKKRTFFWSVILSFTIITFIILVLFVSFHRYVAPPSSENIQAHIPGSEDRVYNSFSHIVCCPFSDGPLYGNGHVYLFP